MSSWIPTSATFVTIAAKKRAQKLQKEEEDMAGYNKDDLEGWEFKIMRSDFGRFKNSDYVQKICQEEAKAGWELIEKFDNYRLRFKRRTDRRAYDQHLDIDPYRTQVSRAGSSLFITIILGILLALVGVFLLIGRDLPRIGQMPWLIILLVLGLMVVIIAAKKSRG